MNLNGYIQRLKNWLEDEPNINEIDLDIGLYVGGTGEVAVDGNSKNRIKFKLRKDAVVAQRENHSPQEVEQVSTRAPDKEITEDPQVGCGKDFEYPEINCGDTFAGKVQLCPECEKARGERE